MTQISELETQPTAALEKNGFTSENPAARREVAQAAPAVAERPVEERSAAAPPEAAPVRNAPEPAHNGADSEQAAGDNGQAKPGRPSWLKRALVVGALAVLGYAIVWGIHYWQFASTHVSTDDAYLTSDIVQVTPQVSGNIAQVFVSENQQVKAGQLIAVLDDSTFRAAVEQARANLAMAEAQAQGAASSVSLTAETGTAQVQQAQGGVAQAESAISGAQADVERARAGIVGALAGEQTARANVKTAQAALSAAISARHRAQDAVRAAQAQLVTAQAGVRSAQAAVTAAQANAEKANKDEARLATLYSEDAVSAQAVDAARAAAASARAQLDSAQQQVAQAQALVAQRQADLSSTREAVHAADDAIAQARAQLAAAKQGVNAAQATEASAQAQMRAAQQNVAQAEAKRAQALGQLNQARTAPRQVAVSRANQQTATARILEARAALKNAEIALQHTRIIAPVSGTVSKKAAEVGQQVAVGQQIMAILPNSDIWVEANFKETQMRDVRPGERAEVEVDTFPGRKFTGRVQSIAPATGATFALLPPENATGNFTKVVQRIPVKVVFDPNQPDLNRLRAGLSAVVTIATK